ncbi:MAG: hypothetical protein RR482_02380 [Clostridia bacterium]
MEQNRFKSVVTWTAIVSFVLSMLVTTGVILPDASQAITGAVSGVLNMLVVFGVLNNPTDKTRF